MSEEQIGSEQHRSNRRRLLKTGAAIVPTIITLHAAPAWAQTDYTMVAYRYGANAGLCKNPNFNPNANANSTAGQEFIQCPDSIKRGRGRTHDIGLGDGFSDEDMTPIDIAPR